MVGKRSIRLVERRKRKQAALKEYKIGVSRGGRVEESKRG
jgi:hypothetical protein